MNRSIRSYPHHGTRLLLVSLVLACLSLPAQLSAGLPTAIGGKKLPSLAPLLDRVTPAVVNISTETRIQAREHPLLSDPFFRHFFDVPKRKREKRGQSLGSGVVVNAAKGYVVTNNHVIEKAHTITVTLRDGRKLDATLVGTDPETDVALLKIQAEKLTALALADSDALRVGDFVVAIGNPFGLGQTVTSGIVSALGRSGLGLEGYEDFIQTDASINPGNSGGPLINLRGELVGVNTAIYAPSGGNVGIGFAIPSNMVKAVIKQLVQHGEVRRGGLGAQAQDLTPELAQAFGLQQGRGAVVARVVAGSPADRAGLRPGDIVTAINGRPVEDADELRNTIGLLPIGERVELSVLRDGKRHTLTATIAASKLVTISGENLHARLEGANLSDIPEGSPLYGRLDGVLVAEVERRSAAWSSGLRSGDVITSVNRVKVASAAEALQAAKRSKNGILLNLQRGDTALFMLIN